MKKKKQKTKEFKYRVKSFFTWSGAIFPKDAVFYTSEPMEVGGLWGIALYDKKGFRMSSSLNLFNDIKDEYFEEIK